MRLGTYAIEQDYSQYVTRASEIILAVVGTATKGPIGVPTVCTSVLDFVNKFGNLNTDCLGLYAGQYALSQMNKIYYIRVASATAAKSIVTADALTFEAKTEGTYYNKYSVGIQDVATVEGDISFTFTVRGDKDVILETVKDIKLKSLYKTVDGAAVVLPDVIKSNYFTLKSVTADAETLTPGVYAAEGGSDGTEDIESADYAAVGNLLLDDNLDFNLLSVPGISDPEVITTILQVAETRGDCLYLVDPPNNLDANAVADWHNGEGAYDHLRFNSDYGALYWSWQRIYDTVNRVRVEVPPSVVVAPVFAKSARLSEIWYAPAGLQRGGVSGVLEPVVMPTGSERDVLYSGNNSVNCIINDAQAGLVVFGQKTLSRQDTALNRVNVRMLLNYLKRVIVAACKHLTFEPNDRVTWNSFEDKIEPTLRSIKDHRGIYEYRIVKGELIVTDTDIDNYRMPCMVLIRPTKAAEEIPIYFTITSTGADFNDVLESNGIIIEE